ncbi:MAG: hypothetical protein ACK559_19765, partial [bacterium]
AEAGGGVGEAQAEPEVGAVVGHEAGGVRGVADDVPDRGAAEVTAGVREVGAVVLEGLPVGAGGPREADDDREQGEEQGAAGHAGSGSSGACVRRTRPCGSATKSDGCIRWGQHRWGGPGPASSGRRRGGDGGRRGRGVRPPARRDRRPRQHLDRRAGAGARGLRAGPAAVDEVVPLERVPAGAQHA